MNKDKIFEWIDYRKVMIREEWYVKVHPLKNRIIEIFIDNSLPESPVTVEHDGDYIVVTVDGVEYKILNAQESELLPYEMVGKLRKIGWTVTLDSRKEIAKRLREEWKKIRRFDKFGVAIPQFDDWLDKEGE